MKDDRAAMQELSCIFIFVCLENDACLKVLPAHTQTHTLETARGSILAHVHIPAHTCGTQSTHSFVAVVSRWVVC